MKGDFEKNMPFLKICCMKLEDFDDLISEDKFSENLTKLQTLIVTNLKD